MTIITGTEKQIAWASQIKAECLVRWNTLRENECIADFGFTDALASLIATAEGITDASDWIDSQDNASVLFWGVGIGIGKPETLPTDMRSYRHLIRLMNIRSFA
jgi:hypothetical protein